MPPRHVDLSSLGESLHRPAPLSCSRPTRIARVATGTLWPSLALALTAASCGDVVNLQAAPNTTSPDAQATAGGGAGTGGSAGSVVVGGGGGTDSGHSPDAFPDAFPDASPDAPPDEASSAPLCTTLETYAVGAWVESLAPDAGAFRGDLLTAYDFEGTIESIAASDAGPLRFTSARFGKTMLSIVDANGTPWSVGFSLPEPTTSLSVGDHVAAHFDYIWRSFDPQKIHLTITKAGRTLVYVGIGGTLDDLTGVPVPLAVGAPACETETDCLTYRGFDLLAVPEAGTVPVALGTTQTVGTCRVTNDGYFHEVNGSSACADAYVALVRVGVQCEPGWDAGTDAAPDAQAE
jgi:hypothetical protein